jgi:hypothetical protein
MVHTRVYHQIPCGSRQGEAKIKKTEKKEEIISTKTHVDNVF